MEKKYLKFRAKINRDIKKLQESLFGNSSPNMEKEIYEQPKIIEELLNRYLMQDGYIMINLPFYINKIVLIASGSSYNCATIIAGIMREYAHLKAQSIYSSEITLSKSYQTEEDTLYIFISQSGETTDTINALRIINKNSQNTLCVTNNEGSTLFEETNYKLLTYAGYERSIAATKSLTAQLVSLILLTIKIMQTKKIENTSLTEDLKSIPNLIAKIFDDKKRLKEIAKKLSKYNNITIIGTRIFYPLAKEAALKIREISYINTNAYPLGEFLHGHIAALNNKTAVISILPYFNKDFCIETIEKIKNDYRPFIITISNFENKDKELRTNYSLIYDSESEIKLLFTSLITIQLLALGIGKCLKRNIDKPQGLSKVVKTKN